MHVKTHSSSCPSPQRSIFFTIKSFLTFNIMFSLLAKRKLQAKIISNVRSCDLKLVGFLMEIAVAKLTKIFQKTKKKKYEWAKERKKQEKGRLKRKFCWKKQHKFGNVGVLVVAVSFAAKRGWKTRPKSTLERRRGACVDFENTRMHYIVCSAKVVSLSGENILTTMKSRFSIQVSVGWKNFR